MVARVYFRDGVVTIEAASLFLPPGNDDVYEWVHEVAAIMEAAAHRFCPPNRRQLRRGQYAARATTGNLNRSISTNVYHLGEVEELSIDLQADMPYAMFVHEGTAYQGRRYIYSREGFANKAEIDLLMRRVRRPRGDVISGWMRPLPRLGIYNTAQLRVHGQKANPFLTDAYNLAQRVHPALPAKRWKRTLFD